MSAAALTFPNRARSYDAVRRRIRFLGYDGMFEVPFFVEDGAITKSVSDGERSERENLAAFDAARDNIIDVARKIYSRGRRTTYLLTAADFR